jgi:hypothetical protein
VLDLDPIAAGDLRAAGYVAKYVSKATDQRGEVPWDTVDSHTGEVVAVPEARYRTWSASRGWGMTMKALREALRLAAQRRAAHLRQLPLTVAATAGGEVLAPPEGRAPPD